MLDFSKHAPLPKIQRINSIWSSIPSQLSKDNKRFYFGHAVKGARARDLADSTQWLIDAGLVFKVTSIEKPGIPLSSYENPSKFKLYMSDVGLLAAMADVPASSILFDDDVYREFKGSMTENYVVTEVAATNAEMHYWASEGRAEVDLIIKIDGKAVPIEIKSGSNVRAFSIREYMSRYGCEYGLLISKRNITSTNIRQVPLALVGRLGDFSY